MNCRLYFLLACLFAAAPLHRVSAQVNWKKKILFAGLEWEVKSGTGGPGPNKWSNSAKSVWVDQDGLHLKIRKIQNVWHCAEVRTKAKTLHGMHRFYVVGRIDSLDPNVIFSPFLYIDDDKELDIEFTKWGDPNWAYNAQYVVQPGPYTPGDNYLPFLFTLGGTHSTHYIDWMPSLVNFKSIHGHYAEPPDPNFLIQEFSYSGNQIPPESAGLRVHLNLWLLNGWAPTDKKAVEVVIRSVEIPLNAQLTSLRTAPPSEITTNSFVVHWEPVIGVMGYLLDVATDSLFTHFVPGYQNLDAGTSTSWNVHGLESGITYYYKVRGYVCGDSSGQPLYKTVKTSATGRVVTLHPITGIKLDQNHPNPFADGTTISFSIEQEGPVELTILDALGSEVAALVKQNLPAGQYRISWRPDRLPKGIYFCRLRCGHSSEIRRLIYQ